MKMGCGANTLARRTRQRQAAITAAAEQHAQTMIDLHRACERYNGEKLAWITWGNCQLNCASASTVRMRLSEAQARDSREAPPGPRASIDSPGTVWYGRRHQQVPRNERLAGV